MSALTFRGWRTTAANKKVAKMMMRFIISIPILHFAADLPYKLVKGAPPAAIGCWSIDLSSVDRYARTSLFRIFRPRRCFCRQAPRSQGVQSSRYSPICRALSAYRSSTDAPFCMLFPSAYAREHDRRQSPVLDNASIQGYRIPQRFHPHNPFRIVP